jgi:hypothetical protein
MALIGSLVINFQANTTDFTRKTKEAQKAVVEFEGGVLGSVRNAARQMSAGFSEMATGLGLLKRTFMSFDVVKSLRRRIGGVASKLWNPLVEGYSLIGRKIAKLTAPLVSRVGDLFGKLNSKVAGGIGYALKWVGDRVGTAFKLIAGGVGKVVGGFVKLGATLAGGVLQGAVSVFKGIASLLTGLVSAAGEVAGALVGVAGELAKVGLGVAAAGVALAFYSAKQAAHFIETVNLQKQTFGEFSGYVVDQAERMNRAFGTNRQEFLRGAAAFGSILQGLGYGARQSAILGSNFARLAADLSASRDLPLEESIQKLQSALSGEFEPLKSLGVLLNEDRIKAYAYANGIARIGSELTQTQKAQATMALVTRGLAADQGALERESTGAAASITETWGRITTLVEDVGMTLAPILAGALQGVNVALTTMRDLWDRNRERVLGFFGITSEALAQGVDGTDMMAEGLAWLAEGWITLKAKAQEYFGVALDGLASLLNATASYISSMADSGLLIGEGLTVAAKETQFALEGAARSLNKSAATWKDSAKETLGRQGENREAVRQAFARGKAIREAAKAGMGKPDWGEADNPENPLKNTPKPLAGKQAWADAQAWGSKEAAQTILRARFGSPKKDETARNTAKTAENTARGTAAIVDLGRKFDRWAAGKQIAGLVGFDG